MVGRPPAGPAPREYAVADTGAWPYCRISGPTYAHAFAAFARQLNERRNGRTHQEFADVTGIDVNVLSRIARGHSWGNAITFLKVCTTLDIDVIGSPHLSVYRTWQLVEDFAAHVGRPELGDAYHPAGNGRWLKGPALTSEMGMYLPESATVIDIEISRLDNSSDWLRMLPTLADRVRHGKHLPPNARSTIIILFPQRPPHDARTWMRHNGIRAMYRTSDGFDDTVGGALLEAIASRSAALPA